jgi:hypothetical protein
MKNLRVTAAQLLAAGLTALVIVVVPGGQVAHATTCREQSLSEPEYDQLHMNQQTFREVRDIVGSPGVLYEPAKVARPVQHWRRYWRTCGGGYFLMSFDRTPGRGLLLTDYAPWAG